MMLSDWYKEYIDSGMKRQVYSLLIFTHIVADNCLQMKIVYAYKNYG